jgi:hypothetical protein
VTTLAWTVEVDADPDTTGEFVIGVSLLGGTDVLSATERWITTGPGTVRSISIRRGRTDESRPYDTGVCEVEFDNRTGDFDPDNPYGRYVMGPQQLLTVGTGLRVKASPSSSVTMFTGYVDEPELQDDTFLPTARYTSVDLLARLGETDVPFVEAMGAGNTSKTRAEWLLDQASIPASARSVQAGGRTVLATTGGGKVRAGLERIAAGEAGRFFVTRGGVVVLTWHSLEYFRTPEIEFDDTSSFSYSGIETTSGVLGVRNAATVHRTPPRARDEETGQFAPGPEIPDIGAVDDDSVGQFGRRPVTVDCVLATDADAESLASYLAHRRALPTSRLNKITFPALETMPSVTAQVILELELASMVTLTRHMVDGRSDTWVSIIEGITVDVLARPTRTMVTLWTAPADTAGVFGGTGWFLIGISLLGSSAVLAPF